jgi:hypothetical protein
MTSLLCRGNLRAGFSSGQKIDGSASYRGARTIVRGGIVERVPMFDHALR